MPNPDWYSAIDPETGKTYPGPCSRCKSAGCHPAIYPISELPVCFECLTLQEQLFIYTTQIPDNGMIDMLLKEAGY